MDVNVVGQGRQEMSHVESSVENTQSVQTTSIKQSSKVESNQSKTSENQPISEKDAKKAVDKLNKLLEDSTTHVEYDHDSTFKSVMIMKVIDNNTNQVITELPSRKILEMVEQFAEMAGLVLDKKA